MDTHIQFSNINFFSPLKLPVNLGANLLIIQKQFCMSTAKAKLSIYFSIFRSFRHRRQSPILFDSQNNVKPRNTNLIRNPRIHAEHPFILAIYNVVTPADATVISISVLSRTIV